MIEKTEIKLDDFGRVVIPSNVRKKFMLKENEYLILESDEEKIILRKKILLDKYKNIIEKLTYLKNSYDLSLFMIDNNEVIYTSKDYNYLLNKKIIKDLFNTKKLTYSQNTRITKNDFLNINHYYFPITIDSSTKTVLFIIANKKNQEKIELIYNLLK